MDIRSVNDIPCSTIGLKELSTRPIKVRDSLRSTLIYATIATLDRIGECAELGFTSNLGRRQAYFRDQVVVDDGGVLYISDCSCGCSLSKIQTPNPVDLLLISLFRLTKS